MDTKIKATRDRALAFAYASLSPTNNVLAMMLAGSKGNIVQFKGMSVVYGDRMQSTFTSRLSCYHPKDVSPTARGWLLHNFTMGLQQDEYYRPQCTYSLEPLTRSSKPPNRATMAAVLLDSSKILTLRTTELFAENTAESIQFKYGDDGVPASATLRSNPGTA